MTFTCPNCGRSACCELSPAIDELHCPWCRHGVDVPTNAFADGIVRRCVVCPSTDLFVRKDFPQRLGVITVGLGILGSSIAWYFSKIYYTYAILFLTAALDLVLYWIVPNALMCYRCGAHYRDVPGLDTFEPFNLETHERYRQQAARLAERQK